MMTSADKGFLARWSRRKRAAAAKSRDLAASEKAADAAVMPAPSPVDSSTLPPLESIGIGDDIRPFLAAGVPADLMRAALRRAWSTDPVIRNFIGLSENSWDFTAADGVPGFASLTAEDIRRLLSQMAEEPKESPAAPRTVADEIPGSPLRSAPGGDAEKSQPSPDLRSASTNAENAAALQHDEAEDAPPQPFRRRHGSALPE
jgi:Protein of unknown function (DUF3306)